MRVSYKAKYLDELAGSKVLERQLSWWRTNVHDPLWMHGNEALVGMVREGPAAGLSGSPAYFVDDLEYVALQVRLGAAEAEGLQVLRFKDALILRKSDQVEDNSDAR